MPDETMPDPQPPTPTNSPDGENQPPPPTPQPEIIPRVCKHCGGSFTVEAPAAGNVFADLLRKWLPSICAACEDDYRRKLLTEAGQRDAAQLAERRRAEWNEIRPDLYGGTDLRRIDPRAVQACREWQFGSMGLALVGDTGAGKTRLLYHTLESFHMAGRRVVALSAKQFEHGISRRSGDSMRELDAYMRGLIRADILAIDDLGKERATERVESELYHVIEQRTANLLPFFFTTQFSDAELAAHYSPDVGSAILRRLKEFCRAVPVVKIQQPR